jgi:hypothetical protein
VTKPPSGDWERAYEASLQAEDERQGRVSGHPTFSEWFIDLRVLLSAALLAAAAVGWLGSKAGLPFEVGSVVAAVVLIPLVCIALRNYYRSQRR